MPTIESIAYATIRLEGTTTAGTVVAGTGILFRLCERDGQFIPVLFTNRHVVRDTVKTVLLLGAADSEGRPRDGQPLRCDAPGAAQGWVFHPNPEIDLCCLPVSVILRAREQLGHRYYLNYLDKSLLPDDAHLAEMDEARDILMLSFPNGIWDSRHNKPLVRRGITATHPKRDYQGKPEFLVDCTPFPGAAGAPVILQDRRNFTTPQGAQTGSQLKLLGLLYAEPRFTPEGNLVIAPIPTIQVQDTGGTIASQLACVLKSRLLLDFEALFPRHGEA